MAVNRYKNHIIVFLEDAPYRDILNGIQLEYAINIDVRQPCGGWKKVFENFQEFQNTGKLDKFTQAVIVLVMDFDDKNNNKSEPTFTTRKEHFDNIVEKKYKNRVFLLGINHKESEDLKKFFKFSNFEDVGRRLVTDCPDNWNNRHLQCNLSELRRMQKEGIFDWLFQTS